MPATFGFDIFKRFRPGRKRGIPQRETDIYPRLQMMLAGQPTQNKRPVFKPTPWNLRAFSRNPYARRAINAIKNPIANLEWEVVPIKGVDPNSEINRQIEIVTNCLKMPNLDDNWSSFVERIFEDIFCGAGCFEMQIGSDAQKPLWLYPVDGLSIQLYPMWDGNPKQPKYCQVPGYGTIAGNVSGVDLRADEICYIAPNPCTSNPFGMGQLEVAFNTISRVIGATEYAGNLASNAKPSTILNLGSNIDQAGLDKFRAWWTAEVEGLGKMPLMANKDAEALKLTPDGDDALFLKWQEVQKSEIGTSFDLSPQNFGIERDVNRNTAEVGEDRDWDMAIKPNAKLFSRKINSDCIQGKLGFTQIEFRFVGLDREDEESQANIYDKFYKINVFTPNQIREKIGEEPNDDAWADMVFADTQIAMQAARGSALIDDPDLNSDGTKAPKPEPKPKAKSASKSKGK